MEVLRNIELEKKLQSEVITNDKLKLQALLTMKIPKSQISGSSYFSSSLISEPPDIKQWFSSYNYQSPELDTNEKDLCYSPGVDDEENGLCVEDSETEDEESGLFVEDSETEEEKDGEDLSKRKHSINFKSTEEFREHEVPSLPNVEVPAYTDSFSMPSEPPDIAKWFSSYVYESPELDSDDFSVSLSSGCTFRKRKEVGKGREDHVEDLPIVEVKAELPSCADTILRSTGFENNKNSSTNEENDSESNLSPENGLCSARTYGGYTFGADLNNCNKIPDKSFDNSKSESEDIISAVKEQQLLSNKDHLRSPVKTPFSPDGQFTKSGKQNKNEMKCIPDKSDSGWISLNRKPREENQVTCMKSKVRPRANKENSPVESVYSSDKQKEGRSRREVLKETTNFDFSCVPEVSGKWRCPQKYKPDTGPPMKQLRLEKWFHR